jgi:hypothetical protein
LSCPERPHSGLGYDERGNLNLLLAVLDVGADLFNTFLAINEIQLMEGKCIGLLEDLIKL